jgi:hypothetical protein
MRMPRFTAEASLYKRVLFRNPAVIVPQAASNEVRPALKITCFSCGVFAFWAYERGDYGLAGYWTGIARGLGCDW